MNRLAHFILVPKLQFGNVCALETPFRRRHGKGVTALPIETEFRKRMGFPKPELGTQHGKLDCSKQSIQASVWR